MPKSALRWWYTAGAGRGAGCRQSRRQLAGTPAPTARSPLQTQCRRSGVAACRSWQASCGAHRPAGSAACGRCHTCGDACQSVAMIFEMLRQWRCSLHQLSSGSTFVNGVQAAQQRERRHAPVHAAQPEVLRGEVLEGVSLLRRLDQMPSRQQTPPAKQDDDSGCATASDIR